MAKFDGYLKMLPRESGLTKKDIQKLTELMPDDETEYMPVTKLGDSEFVSLGFITSQLYNETEDFESDVPDSFQRVINEWDCDTEESTVLPLDEDGKYHIYIHVDPDEEPQDNCDDLDSEQFDIDEDDIGDIGA